MSHPACHSQMKVAAVQEEQPQHFNGIDDGAQFRGEGEGGAKDIVKYKCYFQICHS